MMGCDGIVTGLGNARIEPYVRMYAAAQGSDWQTEEECQSEINVLYGIIRTCGNPIAAVKAAAEISGRGNRYLRQSSQSLSEQQMEKVAALFNEFDRRIRI
jgi:dihydrodipicolinate synthase/N-acetylneuraminate lyase